MPNFEDCDELEDYRLYCVDLFEDGNISDSFVRRIDIAYQTITKVYGVYGNHSFAYELKKRIYSRKVIFN